MTRDELEQTLIQYERGLQDLELLRMVQRGVGDLIVETLANIGPNLGYWEKDQIAFAIDRYAGNVSLWSPMSFGLRPCLQALDNALVPTNKRNDDYTKRDPLVHGLTFEQLMDAAHAVRRVL